MGKYVLILFVLAVEMSLIHTSVLASQGHMGSISAEPCGSREGAKEKMPPGGAVPRGCFCWGGGFGQRCSCQGKMIFQILFVSSFK